jgi:hypothetical protein
MPGPASTSQSAFPVVVHLPKRQADEQSTISAATSASTSTVTPSTSRPATALGPAPKRKPKRPRKSRAPKDSGSGSDSDNYSVVACVDDEAAGTSKAKRIAVLAKADPRTQPGSSNAGPSRATPTLPSKGTVSKRALSRARSEVRTESSSRTDSPSEQVSLHHMIWLSSRLTHCRRPLLRLPAPATLPHHPQLRPLLLYLVLQSTQ